MRVRRAARGAAIALGMGLGPGLALAAGPVHELHETYADFAIEAGIVGGRVRFYQDQLERALGSMTGADAVTLKPGAAADSLVLRYVRDRLVLTARGDTLHPLLLRSGQEPLEHHQGWWVVLHYEADAPIDSLRVTNRLLFDVHDDQRNIMRFVRFPEETRETITLDAAHPAAVVGI